MNTEKNYFGLVFFLLLFLAAKSSCFAQKDSTYINFFKQNTSVYTYLSQMFTSISYEDDSGNRVKYSPNSPLNIGLGFSYKKVGLSASYGVNLPSNDDKGNSKAFEFQYHYYGRTVMFDLFFHSYRGFYTDNEDKTRYIHRPDISLLQMGVFWQYIFNKERFSSTAAFNQSELQMRSVGSLLVGTGVFYNQVRADSALSKSTSLLSQTRINNAQVGVNLGYIHTWVARRFHFTTTLAAGCNFGVIDINNYKNNGVDIYPSLFPRFAIGYNSDTWSINAQYYINIVYTSLARESRMFLATGNGQLTFIKRF